MSTPLKNRDDIKRASDLLMGKLDWEKHPVLLQRGKREPVSSSPSWMTKRGGSSVRPRLRQTAKDAVAKAEAMFVKEAVENPVDTVKEEVAAAVAAAAAEEEEKEVAAVPAPAPAMKEQRPPMSSEQAECMARLKTYLLSTEPRVGFTKPSGKPVLAQREVVEKVADEAANPRSSSSVGLEAT